MASGRAVLYVCKLIRLQDTVSYCPTIVCRGVAVESWRLVTNNTEPRDASSPPPIRTYLCALFLKPPGLTTMGHVFQIMSEHLPPTSQFNPKRDIPDLSEKVVIVTGWSP